MVGGKCVRPALAPIQLWSPGFCSLHVCTVSLLDNRPVHKHSLQCLEWLGKLDYLPVTGPAVPVSVPDAILTSWQPNTAGELRAFVATASSTSTSSHSSVFLDKLHIPSSTTSEKSNANDCWETAVMDEIDKQNINVSSVSSSDTDLDSIKHLCSFPLDDIVCSYGAQVGRYRTADGTCNNLYYPIFGASGTQFARLVPVGCL